MLALIICCCLLASTSAAETVSDINRYFSTSPVSFSTSEAPLIRPPKDTDIFLFEPPIIAPPASVTSPLRVTNLIPPICALAVDIESTINVFLNTNLIAVSIFGSYSRSSCANPITPGLLETMRALPAARVFVNLFNGRKVARPALFSASHLMACAASSSLSTTREVIPPPIAVARADS